MKSNQTTFLRRDDKSNLADLFWIVESQAQRFKDNFRGLVACAYTNDIISVEALWLKYKPSTCTRKRIVKESPCDCRESDIVEKTQSAMLGDFSYSAQASFQEVMRIAQKGVSLNLINELPCPEYEDFIKNFDETSFDFECSFKPLELRRQMALFFLRKRVFENQHIKPENIFYSAMESGAQNTDFASGRSWLKIIEGAYNDASEWQDQFMLKELNARQHIRALSLVYLAIENIISKKIFPEGYRRKLIPEESLALWGCN